ncbi:dihydrofolate reductase family protein [Cellulomonas sp. NS3]|uniref:dihydrofolate reductase family protein n=1 Tax=Cellulomonas sp. NS3 TaxID=2973977 RepID=UPI002163FC77|nr:dihydrofolate reductase family protein [Cellulomonas sp. NS3]
MARLVYLAVASLDGYVEDASGAFDWAAPDDEVHAFVNDLARPVGTYLYGRRMYETMAYWETASTGDDVPAPERDFAQIWRAADKVVHSRTLPAPTTARTRLERRFEPADVRRLVDSAASDVAVGGADLAGQALAAGLVDECQLVLCPVAVGAGKPVFPVGVRVGLELVEERRFRAGAVFLRYAVPRTGRPAT